MAMRTEAAATSHDDFARRVTTDLYRYVCTTEMDVPTVLEMYDWVRDGNVARGADVNLPELARRWSAYEREERGFDWLRRAFGE